MKIDIVNFSRHATIEELRWFVGEQLPAWIRQMIDEKQDGSSDARCVEALADVCCVEPRKRTVYIEGL